MTAEFCGNPFNHDAHSKDRADGSSFWCDGVGRVEVAEEIVEKYDPTVQAADGTHYAKVTIIVEHADKSTDIIEFEKASAEMLELETERYVAIEYVTKDFNPAIRRAIFSFTPAKDLETGVFFTVKRMDKDGNPR